VSAAEGARRAVFVSQRFPPDKGGNAARLHDMAAHLGDGDWEVTVLAPPPSYPPGEFDRSWRRSRTETVDGVTVHRLWSWQPRAGDPGTADRLAYYLLFGIHAAVWLFWHVRRYDAVVTTTPPVSTGAPGLVAAALGAPWLVDVRDLWIDAAVSLGYLEAGGALERLARRFQRLVLGRADRIAVTTGTLGEALAEQYGESLRGKTVLLPNGVDVDRFRSDDARAAPRDGPKSGDRTGDGTTAGDDPARPDVPDPKPDGGGPPVVIYTGNLGSAQDLESCIRAMAHVPEPAVLRLVGSGDTEADLRRLVNDLGLGDRVEFAGLVPREEVPGLLAGATVGIAPLEDTEELAYAMPTKVYEYMASGLPALVTGRGEVERFVEASGGGVHAANDPERIAARLTDLLEDGSRRRRMARDGFAYVAERYDRREIARRLEAELDALVGDGGGERSGDGSSGAGENVAGDESGGGGEGRDVDRAGRRAS